MSRKPNFPRFSGPSDPRKAIMSHNPRGRGCQGPESLRRSRWDRCEPDGCGCTGHMSSMDSQDAQKRVHVYSCPSMSENRRPRFDLKLQDLRFRRPGKAPQGTRVQLEPEPRRLAMQKSCFFQSLTCRQQQEGSKVARALFRILLRTSTCERCRHVATNSSCRAVRNWQLAHLVNWWEHPNTPPLSFRRRLTLPKDK